jgi:hypothetical protein
MKVKNGYFYSDDPALIKRIAEELTYSGRNFKVIPGGIMQFAIPPAKPKKEREKKESRHGSKKSRD